MAPCCCQKSWGIGDIENETVQSWTGTRERKDTTEIMNSDGSDLTSEKGNLDFETEIWFSEKVI